MNRILYKNLKEEILNNLDMDTTLVVISGYVGPTMIEELSSKCLKTIIVYGMYGLKGVNCDLHKVFCNMNNNTNLKILYSLTGTNAKSYFIIKNDEIVKCFIGSADVSSNGLSDNEYQGTLVELTTFDKLEIEEYIKYIVKNSVDCKNVVINHKSNESIAMQNPFDVYMPLYLVDKTRRKYVPKKKGLNFTHQGEHSSTKLEPTIESYINISSKHIDNYPLLFTSNDPFEIIWDDGFVMKCLFTGTGVTRNGRTYPKQIISTGEDGNSLLGK